MNEKMKELQAWHEITEYQRIRIHFAQIRHDKGVPLREISRATDKLISIAESGHIPDEIIGLAKIIEKNAYYLSSLINDTADEVWRNADRRERIYIKKFFNSIIDSWLSTCEKKIDLELTFDLCDEYIKWYPIRLQRIMYNLLNNAYKHGFRGRDGGEVKVHCQTVVDELSVTVEDNGNGIEPDFTRYIWDSHMRSRESHYDDGSGMGLYICKKLLKQTGDIITCNSLLGKGTVFLIKIDSKRKEPRINF